jgi:hypothetical protein
MRVAGQAVGIAPGGTFGGGIGAAAWAKKMVEETLPGIYRELSGGAELSFRTESVRAGGPIGQDPANLWTTGQFVGTTQQVAAMQQNPYLSVEVGGPVNGDAGLVATNYFYPDPLRISGLQKATNLISPTMLAKIQAAAGYTGASAGSLAPDTQALMKDLLLQMFTNMYGKSACTAGGDFQGALQMALNLVSIHPCSDFNGRSTRFFMLVAALEGCGNIPVSFMSDFDIVTQFSAYYRFMQDANAGYLQLKVAMIAELLSSLANNVVARQYDLPEWSTLLKTAFKSFGTKAFTTELTDAENDQVRKRDFVPLMDQWFGKTWRQGK